MYRQALMMGIVEIDPTSNAFHFTEKRRNPTDLGPKIGRLEAAFEQEAEYLTTRDKYPTIVLDVFLLLRDSGLRIGEALALRRQDFDPHAGTVTVRGTMTDEVTLTGQRSIRQAFGKTEAAFRTVTLPRGQAGLTSRAALERWWARAEQDTDPLFPTRANTFISTNNYRTRWRNALRRWDEDLYPTDRAGQVHPHLVRHTVATVVVRESVGRHGYAEGMERARLQLGHASFKPMIAYLDKTSIAIDNSDVLGTLNPAVARQAAAMERGHAVARAEGFTTSQHGYSDGLPILVVWHQNGRENDSTVAAAKVAAEVGPDAIVKRAMDVEGFDWDLPLEFS